MLIRDPLWAQSTPASKAAASPLTTIHRPFTMTPKQALDWHVFKADCGPTYAGSTGWKRFTDFLISKMPEFGGVDFDYVEIPYDHYIVEDWPDRQTHMHASPKAVEKLITDALGRWAFRGLTRGRYTVHALAPGYLAGGYGQPFATSDGPLPTLPNEQPTTDD